MLPIEDDERSGCVFWTRTKNISKKKGERKLKNGYCIIKEGKSREIEVWRVHISLL
jgi:hypothetical protein